MQEKDLIKELSNLEMARRYLKRQLDINASNRDLRIKIFNEIKDIDKKRKAIKFKIQLVKEMFKNEKSG